MIRDICMYIGLALLVVVMLLGLAKIVLPMAEEIRIVSPAPGIECAVVSRLANTSIDCWKEDR